MTAVIDWTVCASCGKRTDDPDGWPVGKDGKPCCGECLDRANGRAAATVADAAPRPLHIVTWQQFALIPENGDVMFYCEGGASKTTLVIDLAAQLAAGDDWLGIPVGRPLPCLLIEDQGPR